MDKIKCPKCGVYNDPNSTTCSECGAALEKPIANVSQHAAQKSDGFFDGTPPKVLVAFSAVIICGCTLFSLIFYNAGKSTKYSATIAKAVASQRLTADSDYAALQSNISAAQNTQSDLNDYKSHKSALDSQFSSEKNEASSLAVAISSKQSELNQLSGKVAAAKGAPKTLPAGDFIVGQDIPAGRYKVTGSSNFFVHTADGDGKVNTILGDGSDGLSVTEYVCQLDNGDQIEEHSATTFTPVN